MEEEIQRQTEAARCAVAVSEAEQGQWEKVGKKKPSWREMWGVEVGRIRLMPMMCFHLPLYHRNWTGNSQTRPFFI